MKTQIRRTVLAVAVAVLTAAGLFVLGRVTVGHAPVGSTNATTGRDSQHSYLQGLQAGEAQGLQEGRALQIGAGVPAGTSQPVQEAFNSGYAAGSNDAFAGYDGGWTTGAPYVVTLEPGNGAISYRITDRKPLEPKVSYFLCPNGHDLCQEPRN